MENNKRVPLMHITEKENKRGELVIYKKYVYKAINAWGDSFRAQEFYTTGQQSVLDNGFDKVANEVEDSVIVDIYKGGGVTSTGAVTVTEPVSDVIDSSKKINIYAGTGENAELSNFAIRPFVPNATKAILGESATIKFNTVEGAFQAAKVLYTNNLSKEDNDFNKSIVGELQTATGAEAKRLGQQIKGLNSSEWDKVSANVMKDLMSASFEQNPDALNNLLATDNAELTHTQDKTKWGTEFPRLLMEVRQELRPKQPVSSEVKGSIKMQPDNIAKIKAGTKTITNRTEKEKLEDGVYTLPDGTKVEVKSLGLTDVQYIGDSILVDSETGKSWSGDDYAKAEGFKDWNDFEKNNKFSANFINGTQSRYVYSIKTVSEKPEEKVKVDNSTLKDGDVVYDKLGTKFIFRGLRQADQTGAGSPRLERTDGTGEIAIPGANIELFKVSITKPDSISQEEWDGLSQEEKNKINEC
jgi:predicted NAD-dependent protein-ADP-ribosyltransferase YbiA (DUF1768 family)